MKQTLARLSSMVDVVIIDSPPFIVADAAVLASRVDGLLLVVRPEYTRKELVEGMRKQILRINPKIFGVVLNRVSAGVDIYTSYYGHYGAKSDKNGKGSKGQEKEAGVPASRLVSSKVKGSKGK
jgi:Mrp family chromosome partitioning ATPase